MKSVIFIFNKSELMGYGHGIKIARSTLGYLAMDDELKKRLELAYGTIRALGTESKTPDISRKNQRKIDQLDVDFKTLTMDVSAQRDLEIYAEKLVSICADIIEDNSKARVK